MAGRAELVILNGPPAVGKTTLAALLAASRQGMRHLDVDELRSRIPGWERDRLGAGRNARHEMHEQVRTLLRADHSVVVSQLFGRDDDLIRLSQTASDYNASYFEVVLTATQDDAFRRFVGRGGEQLRSLGHDHEIVDGFNELHHRVMSGPAHRAEAVHVETVPGDIGASFAQLLKALASA